MQNTIILFFKAKVSAFTKKLPITVFFYITVIGYKNKKIGYYNYTSQAKAPLQTKYKRAIAKKEFVTVVKL